MPLDIDQVHVKRAEDRLKVKFSLSYVTAMCRSNGGCVIAANDHWNLFPIFDNSDRRRITRTADDVVRNTISAREGWMGFPPEGIAIGENGGGDLLVFLPDECDATRLSDTVYWWDHETGNIDAAADDFLDLQRCDKPSFPSFPPVQY